MKITYTKALDAYTVMKNLRDQKMKIKLGLLIAKNIEIIGGEETFFQHQYQDILKKFLIADESGNFIPSGTGYKIQEGKAQELNDAIEALSSMELDLPIIPIPEALLEELEIELQSIAALMPIIEGE